MATTTISPERLAELRAMLYEEYLFTPEWQATRKRILKRDHSQCQGCHATNVLLHVHHYTYVRLGCELDEDLVTLCEACHDELHRLMADPPKLSFLQRCSVGLGTAALGTIGIEGFLHAPLPAEIGVLIGAFLLAKNSPHIYGKLKEMLPSEVMAWFGQEPSECEKGSPSFLDIWLARTPQGRRDKMPTDEQIEVELKRIQQTDEEILSRPNTLDDELTPNWVNDLDKDTIATFGEKKTGIFFFSELLATGWRPSWNEIFVGRTMEGKNIFVPALDLCHVAFAGKTGGGKGSLMRLIMVQLCYIGAPVVLLNPDYMRWVVAKEGPTFDEDWTPFEGKSSKTGKPYLEKSPLECANMPMIKSGLKWAATELLESRKQRARTQKVNFVPYFMVIDEWPTIQDELGKEMTGYLGKLLRDGRKYRVYVIIASQDFQVKTMGMEGEGSIRKCLLTVFYTGGDLTSRRELLNEETRTTPENKIGKGVVLMRCTGTDNEVILAQVPFVDNESVYTLLGPSTYTDDEYSSDGLEDGFDLAEASAQTSLTVATMTAVEPVPEVAKRDTRRKAEDIDLKVAVALWNSGFNSRAKLAKALDIAENQASKLMEMMDVKPDGRMDG